MRRLLAALAACCVLASVAAGAGLHGTLVEGTVQTDEGDDVEDAVVLVQPADARVFQNVTSGDRPVRAALVDLANDPPIGIRSNQSVSSGDYVVHLSRQGEFEVIALSSSGVSKIYTVTVRYQSARQNLTVDPDRIQSLEAGNGGVARGETTTLPVRVNNTDDEPIRNLTVTLETLPAGWTVERVETDGTYRRRAGRLTWSSVPAGGTAVANVTVSVPENESLRTRTISLSATADEHFVEHTDGMRVRVHEPNVTVTPPPTATPTDAGGGIISLPASTPTGPAGGGVPMVLVYGNLVLLVGVGVFSYSLGKTGLPWR